MLHREPPAPTRSGNPHSYMKDFEDEQLLYLQSDRFLSTLALKHARKVPLVQLMHSSC